MTQPKKILFVCLGNICRSPMAEFVLKDLLAKRKLEARFEVSSAATSDENVFLGVGAPVYPPAARKLREHGIDCAGKRAVQLKRADYENWDLFVCMDDANVRNVLRIFDGDPDGKVCKLLDFTDRGGSVADPWYTGDFETAYRDIEIGCKALLEQVFYE